MPVKALPVLGSSEGPMLSECRIPLLRVLVRPILVRPDLCSGLLGPRWQRHQILFSAAAANARKKTPASAHLSWPIIESQAAAPR